MASSYEDTSDQPPRIRTQTEPKVLKAEEYENFVLYREFTNFRQDIWYDIQAIIKRLDTGHECQQRIEKDLKDAVTGINTKIDTINANVTNLTNARTETIEAKKSKFDFWKAIIVAGLPVAGAVLTLYLQSVFHIIK